MASVYFVPVHYTFFDRYFLLFDRSSLFFDRVSFSSSLFFDRDLARLRDSSMEDIAANRNLLADFLNSYYMPQNENPSLVLVTSPLNGENYHQWSRSNNGSLMEPYLDLQSVIRIKLRGTAATHLLYRGSFTRWIQTYCRASCG